MPQQPSSHSSGTKNGSQKKDDPTDSLQQALANFQDSLTAEQQKKLTASTVVPNAEEVLYFVAKLDAENGSKTRRSVSPRLCTFLSAVQQFAGAVETFVSSNPKIGALIWGSIKTAMTMAGNIASYFDKITKMIEKIGRFCPTYQKFGQLYQGCVGLQQALCEYYVVIVELCTKVIKISQRTWASQTFSPILNPFESEFESFLERLEAASEQIHQQTSLASKQANLEAKKLLELESKENVLFRSSALELLGKVKRHTEKTSEWRICQTEREIASLKGKIRNNLSPVDHMRPWNRALKQKVQSTADWLIHDPTFLEWRDSPDSTILWCSGTMGVGKTILMSSVISHLRASRQNNKSVAVAHFLCLAENEDSLSARNLVGSLTRQLLDRHIDECTHSTLLSLQSESQSFYTNDIAQLLLSHLTADNTYYIVLDGLDECGLTQVREMANILALFFKSKRLKIICASRPELEEDLFKCVKPQHRVVMDEEKVTRDIALYITATLYDCLEEGTLVLGDNTIIDTIVDALQAGSKGMFLWARLCISDLCEKNCDQDILEALNHLPRGLAEIFDSRICRIQKQQEGYQAIKLLKYCGTAKRPLTIDEYKELLGLSTGDTFLDRKKMPNNIKRLVRGCFGLTFVDDEEYTIHYIHHSIKEHLFSPQSHEAARFDAGGIELELGLLCMTYLNLADFTGQLSRVSKSYVDPIVLGASTVTTSSSGKKLAQKLLRRRGESMGIRFDAFERTVLESAKEHGARNCFQFLAYANIHWLLHLRDLKPRDIESWSLFGKCIENRNLPLVRPWESQIEAAPKDPWFKFAADLSPYLRRDPSALMWCLNQKQYALFLYFTMNIALHGPPSEEVTTFPPFDDADDIHWIDMLISVPSFSLSWGSWLLNVMAVESLSNPTRLKHSFELLRKMAAVNPTEARLAFKKALNVAILKDEGLDLMLSVDELFYKEDAIFREDPRIYEKMHDYIEKYARFPTLVWASREGNLDMTLAVLAVGANINVQDDSGHTAIHMAAVHGHLNMLKELRAAGADMTLRNDAGELAIHVAADQGRKDIVGYLLSLGIDPNVAASSGETALQLAASKGHTQLLAFLMAVGANVNQVDRRSATALHKAANRSRSESADYLLSVGASVHMKDHLGETALHKAAKNGASILVKSLLAAGADPLAANNNGLTVLDLASLGGNMELVEIFQSGGAVACTGEVYGLSK